MFLLIGNCYSQKSSTFSVNEENKIVLDIRKKFTEIENDYSSKYKRVEKELNDYSTEGGTATMYYNIDQIRKVKISFYGETGKSITEYYIWDNKVFFMFRKSYYYNSPIYFIKDIPEEGIEAFDEKKTEVFEDRYYFSSEKLIRWIDSDKMKVEKPSPKFNVKMVETMEDIHFLKSEIVE